MACRFAAHTSFKVMPDRHVTKIHADLGRCDCSVWYAGRGSANTTTFAAEALSEGWPHASIRPVRFCRLSLLELAGGQAAFPRFIYFLLAWRKFGRFLFWLRSLL